MTPLGASRNEALVQAAGNAGMRLADPAAYRMFAGNGVMPATSEDVSRRMLSEFGSGRPVLAPAAAFDTSSEAASAAIAPKVLGTGSVPLSQRTLDAAARGFAPEVNREIGSVPLSQRTLDAAARGFAPEVAAGDRFSHLRPDLATWARANQGAAKGVDGLNIVDRFMTKQGAAPLTPPANFPQAVAFDPAHSYASPGELSTTGANIGRSAEVQALDSNTFERPAANATATAFDPSTDLVDQVQMLREMYRNNSRPNPGVATPLFWN
jgi:hypothetical protein